MTTTVTDVHSIDVNVDLAGAPEVTDVLGVTFVPVIVRYAVTFWPPPDRPITSITVLGPEFDNKSYMDPYDTAPAWVPPAPKWLVQVIRDLGVTGPIFARATEASAPLLAESGPVAR